MKPRPPRSSRPRWLAVVLALLVGAWAEGAAPESERLRDTDYVSLTAFAAQFGLTATWLEPQKKLVLRGANTRLEFEAESREMHVNGLRTFLGVSAVFHARTLFVSETDRDRFLGPLLEPGRIAGAAPGLHTIVIDPGHGGADTGAQNTSLRLAEKDCTLDVARRLEKLLVKAGYRVMLTRHDDRFVPLPERPARARRVRADLFLAIHFNALANHSIAGTETYVLTPQNQPSTEPENDRTMIPTLYPGNRTDPWNAVLGYRIHQALLAELHSTDRGLKRARYAVLRDLDCPGVLIEGGYLSQTAEARRIATSAWRDRLARAIAAGVESYRATLPRATPAR